MKTILLALALLATTPSHAREIAQYAKDDVRFVLTSDSAPECGLSWFRFNVYAGGKLADRGCWRMTEAEPNTITVLYDNLTVARYPATAFKRIAP